MAAGRLQVTRALGVPNFLSEGLALSSMQGPSFWWLPDTCAVTRQTPVVPETHGTSGVKCSAPQNSFYMDTQCGPRSTLGEKKWHFLKLHLYLRTNSKAHYALKS